MDRRLLAFVVVAVASLGCASDPPASVLAVVSSDVLVEEADELVLAVERVEGDTTTERTSRTSPSIRDGSIAPWSIEVRPFVASDPGRIVYRFRAAARRAGREIVVRQHRIAMVPGRRVVLPLQLTASCAGVTCGQDQTCIDGRCADDALDACELLETAGSCTTLVPRPPTVDASVDARSEPDARPETDAGPEVDARTETDADLDAASDAGSDGDAGDAAAPVARTFSRGFGSTCVIQLGRVWCWGSNLGGQLGDGTREHQPTARQIVGLEDVVQVSTGAGHGCAVRSSGELVCWGSNFERQLARPPDVEPGLPEAVSAIPPVVEVACGLGHTCARTAEGTVLCWGRRREAQLGDGVVGTDPSDGPVVVAGLDDAVELASGALFTCARRPSGHVSCWGSFSPDPLPGSEMRMPVELGGLERTVSISAGYFHGCAHRDDGLVFCWGSGLAIGGASFPTVRDAAEVPGVGTVAQVVAGQETTCVRDASGTVRCFGRGDRGQIGDPSLMSSSTAFTVGGLDDATDLGLGWFHSCARRPSGEIVCWGDSSEGQTGRGTISVEPDAAPAPVVGLP